MKGLLGLGSNLIPHRQLTRAIQAIRNISQTQVLSVAPYYRNPAWGKRSSPDYYNTVVQIETTLTPLQLLRACQHIETRQKRTRRERYAARTLDIDILSIGALHSVHPKLTLPHPRMHERDFVQIPLSRLNSQ